MTLTKIEFKLNYITIHQTKWLLQLNYADRFSKLTLFPMNFINLFINGCMKSIPSCSHRVTKDIVHHINYENTSI